MSNQHPGAVIRVHLFFRYLFFTLLVMLALNWIGSPLTTQQAPYGIISYEFARTPQQANAIISSWDSPVMLRAAFSLGLDYLFMPLYAITISQACRWASSVLVKRRWPLSSAGEWLAGGMWLAAGLDATENIALTAFLFGAQQSFWPVIAYVCASIKFLLIFLGLVYLLLGLVVRLVVAAPVESA